MGLLAGAGELELSGLGIRADRKLVFALSRSPFSPFPLTLVRNLRGPHLSFKKTPRTVPALSFSSFFVSAYESEFKLRP